MSSHILPSLLPTSGLLSVMTSDERLPITVVLCNKLVIISIVQYIGDCRLVQYVADTNIVQYVADTGTVQCVASTDIVQYVADNRFCIMCYRYCAIRC